MNIELLPMEVIYNTMYYLWDINCKKNKLKKKEIIDQIKQILDVLSEYIKNNKSLYNLKIKNMKGK